MDKISSHVIVKEKPSKIVKILTFLGTANLFALIFIFILFPLIFGLGKLIFFFCALFFLTCLFFLYNKSTSTISLSPQIFKWLSCFFLLNLFFVSWGVVNGASNDGFSEALLIYILSPIVYVFFILTLPRLLSINNLTLILLFCSIIAACIVVAHALRVAGVSVPGYDVLFIIYPEAEESIKSFAFTGDNGYMPRVMERFIFFIPFSVALVPVRKSFGLGRFSVWVNLLLVTVVAFVSCRRAMLVLLLLSYVVVFVQLNILQPRKSSIKILVATGLVAILTSIFFLSTNSAINIDGSIVMQRSAKITDNYIEDNLQIRKKQLEGLVSATEKFPLLGVGFGNSIPGYRRSSEHPWRVELTYVAFLPKTGVFGTTLYLFLFVSLVIIAIRSYKAGGKAALPYIYGLIGGLLAISTNPYLNYGSGQWLLFLPLGVFNCLLLKKINYSE